MRAGRGGRAEWDGARVVRGRGTCVLGAWDPPNWPGALKPFRPPSPLPLLLLVVKPLKRPSPRGAVIVRGNPAEGGGTKPSRPQPLCAAFVRDPLKKEEKKRKKPTAVFSFVLLWPPKRQSASGRLPRRPGPPSRSAEVGSGGRPGPEGPPKKGQGPGDGGGEPCRSR